MRTYWHAVTHVDSIWPLLEPRLYQTHSLHSFWSLLLPWSPRIAFALYAFSAIGILILTVRCWQQQAFLKIRYSALLLATVLVSPHLTVYDLVILAPAFLVLGEWNLARRDSVPPVSLLLYACYLLFLAGPLARTTHLQLSVVAMTLLLWSSWRISHGRAASATVTPSTVSL
jgi:hypothetical protein